MIRGVCKRVGARRTARRSRRGDQRRRDAAAFADCIVHCRPAAPEPVAIASKRKPAWPRAARDAFGIRRQSLARADDDKLDRASGAMRNSSIRAARAQSRVEIIDAGVFASIGCTPFGVARIEPSCDMPAKAKRLARRPRSNGCRARMRAAAQPRHAFSFAFTSHAARRSPSRASCQRCRRARPCK